MSVSLCASNINLWVYKSLCILKKYFDWGSNIRSKNLKCFNIYHLIRATKFLFQMNFNLLLVYILFVLDILVILVRLVLDYITQLS